MNRDSVKEDEPETIMIVAGGALSQVLALLAECDIEALSEGDLDERLDGIRRTVMVAVAEDDCPEDELVERLAGRGMSILDLISVLSEGTNLDETADALNELFPPRSGHEIMCMDFDVRNYPMPVFETVPLHHRLNQHPTRPGTGSEGKKATEIF